MIRSTIRLCCHVSIAVARAVLDALDPHPHVDEPLALSRSSAGLLDFRAADEFGGYRFHADDETASYVNP